MTATPVRAKLESFEWQAGVLALLVLIAYANSLGSSFHFDDYAMFADPYIVGPGFGWGLFRLDQTRPLTYLTFHWNYLISGQDPLLYHLVNLLLHAGNSILLLACARKYLSPFTAGCVAVLFALHPLQTESVTYVFDRSTLLSTHFALWTLWFFERGRFVASALFFGVSLLAKEETIALPGFLLLLDLFERRRPRPGYYALLAGFAALVAGRLYYVINSAPIAVGLGRVRGVSPVEYLLTQSRVLWVYLRLMIAPLGLNLDRDMSLSTGLLSPFTTLPALLGLALLIGGLIFLTRQRNRVALWALGFFILILPSSSVVPQADLIFEHRTYFPMLCLVIALGFLLDLIPREKLTIGFAALIPLMLIGTISRNANWYDEKTFWTDIAAKSPDKGRSWLGLARVNGNDPEKAREYLSRGLAIEPDNPDLHNNYAIALLSSNEPAQALTHFERAMALKGATADGWNNIGAAYFRLNNIDEALKSFEKALTLDACNFNARRNVMMIHSSRNEPQAVWQAGEIPRGCAMIPDQARELETLRRTAGKP